MGKEYGNYEILDLFLNKGSDLVYISDMDSYEIIYVNKETKKLFNDENIIGKKCYEAFQKKEKPCDFCNNSIIKKSKEFHEGIFFNTNLNKNFRLKDKVIKWFDGRDVRLEIARPVSEEAINSNLSKIIKCEKGIESILNDFSNGIPIEVLIKKILNLIGDYTKASRVYIFNIDLFGNFISNTYEWCDNGVEAQINNLKSIPCSSIPWWMGKLIDDKHIFIPDVDEMPKEAYNEKEILACQDIKSLIVIPLKLFNQLYGFIGIDNVKENSVWNENEVKSLMNFVDLISKLMEKKYKGYNIEEIRKRYDTIFDATTNPTIIVNEDKNIVIYNDEFNEFIGLEKGVSIHGLLIDDYMKPKIELEKSNNKEFKIKTKNGFKDVVIASKKLSSTNQYIVTLFDITKMKQTEKELMELSYKDKLTNLYNRNKYINDIAELSKKSTNELGFIICDIDGLKFINDSLGHDYGDDIIKRFSKILIESTTKLDLKYRVGGDEFVIISKNSSKERLKEIVLEIKRKISEFNKDENFISASAGIAYGKDINKLLKEADVNMYREKVTNNKNVINEIIDGFGKALETKDYGILDHGKRMKKYALLIADKLELEKERKAKLKLLCKFHDIGKIAIENEILFKPDKLTKEEFRLVKQHSEIGYRIARNSAVLEPISDFILKHHERYDGLGYPLGIKGEEIPLECRIVALVDTFDVITNERHYKNASSKKFAIEEIQRCMGTQFDPKLAKIFLEILKAE